MLVLRDWRICAASVEPVMARMGEVALKARLYSWVLARARSWRRVWLVRRGEALREELWIVATLRRS